MRSSAALEKLRTTLFRNAPAKAVSLAVAVVVFFFVRTTSLEQRYVTVPLELRVAPRYTVTAGLPSTVTITLRGEGGEIFQISPDDIVAFVDLTENHNEGVFRVPVRYEKKGEAAVVNPLEISVDPADVTATIEQLITKTVRILPVIGAIPPEGYTLTEYVAEPGTIQVTGPRKAVEALRAIPTMSVDLSETRESSSIPVKLDYDSLHLRLSGASQVELRLEVTPPPEAEPGIEPEGEAAASEATPTE